MDSFCERAKHVVERSFPSFSVFIETGDNEQGVGGFPILVNLLETSKNPTFAVKDKHKTKIGDALALPRLLAVPHLFQMNIERRFGGFSIIIDI